MLRIVAGLETPTQGEVTIGGRVVTQAGPCERDLANVFQDYALYPHMSAYQNLAFALKATRMKCKAIDHRVREVAGLLGIESLLHRRPRALSGGERQRVVMGRAIVRRPAAFLMDEPLSNLDAKLRGQLRSEIRRLHRELGATFVYVTHDQTEALTIGDRVAVLRRGVLQQLDDPQRLYDRPANLFVAGFIGTPPMNLLLATVDADGVLPMARVGPWVFPRPPGFARAGWWSGSGPNISRRHDSWPPSRHRRPRRSRWPRRRAWAGSRWSTSPSTPHRSASATIREATLRRASARLRPR